MRSPEFGVMPRVPESRSLHLLLIARCFITDRWIMPYIIGLTGNIACGKSTVRGMLEEHGAATLDADALVHELYLPGDPVYRAVVETFGADILAADGTLDRRAL